MPRRRLGIAAAMMCLPAAAAVIALRPERSSPRFSGISIKASSSYQDAALLQVAWNLPVARLFAHHIDAQSNPGSCGPSSLANVERSFGLPRSEDSILHGTGKCLLGICLGGLTLDELAEVAGRTTHHHPEVFRDLTYEAFREHLRRSNDPDRRYVINFHRTPLFGEGHGHHSPIGGFLEDRDLVFILDVNARYQPFLVDARRLFEAMDTTDSSTGKKRGLLALVGS